MHSWSPWAASQAACRRPQHFRAYACTSFNEGPGGDQASAETARLDEQSGVADARLSVEQRCQRSGGLRMQASGGTVLSALRRAAHAGIGSIRCKWGSVQEATALWELMHAVPQGSLEEIGLCRVEPAVLREQYGFAEGALPPMGASPDGLIRQQQPLLQPSTASAVRPVRLACFDRTR